MRDSQALRTTPYVVLSESRRALLGNFLHEKIQCWAREWLGSDAAARGDVVDVPVVATDSRVHEAACFRATEGGRGGLIFIVPARCVPHLLGVRGDCADRAHQRTAEESLAGRLEMQALQSLARELLGGGSAPGMDRIANPLPAVLRECVSCRHVAAQVTFVDTRFAFFTMLPAEFVESSVPIRRNSRPAVGERLEARRAGIADELVRVEAILGTAEVSVADFSVLDVGDVIVLDQALTDMAGLFVKDGSRAAGAAPGRVEARRAIQITG